ncbi:MAG: nitroreductase family protein [Chloroflexota bacterium]|nr:nitroreductase family protein [Chloroflexota bacterium]
MDRSEAMDALGGASTADGVDAAGRLRPLIRVRQVRQFTDEPVSDQELGALADVARWSGSSRNTQPWRFIVIRELPKIRSIAAASLPQTRSLVTAPAAIAITMPSQPGSAVSFAYDEGRAAERILIGAHLLGLGAAIAWLVPDARPAVAAQLGLPADRSIRTIMAVGHPSEAGARRKSAPGQARLPREEVVFNERWPSETPGSRGD